MALGHWEPQYQLLNGKKKYSQPIVHTMVLIGLAVLVICVVLLMIYISSVNVKGTNPPIDFVVAAPQRYTNSTPNKT